MHYRNPATGRQILEGIELWLSCKNQKQVLYLIVVKPGSWVLSRLLIAESSTSVKQDTTSGDKAAALLC
jgi:hypothetical protein